MSGEPVAAAERDPFERAPRRCRASGPAARVQRGRRAGRRRRPRRAGLGSARAAKTTRRCCWRWRWRCARPRLGHVLRRPGDDPRHRRGRRRGAGRPGRAALARAGRVDRARRAPARWWPRRRRRTADAAPAAARRHAGCTWTATGPRRSQVAARAAGAWRRARRRRRSRACWPTGSTRLFGDDADGRQRAGRGRRGAPAVGGRGRRPRHRQDDHGGADRGPARRAGGRGGGAAAADRAGRADRQGGGAAAGGGPRRGRAARRRRRASATSCWACGPPPCTACWAGGPGSHSRFRHDRGHRLPHDVVIVDETSMVSLSLMARLIEALRSDARLILVGDPGQLASIEAGAVLGDIVGPAADGADARPAIGAGIVVLRPGAPLRRRDRARWPPRSARGDADAVMDAAAPPAPTTSPGSRSTWPSEDAAARPVARARAGRGAGGDRGRPRRPRARARWTRWARSGSCAPTAAAPTASRAGPRGWRAGWPPSSRGFDPERSLVCRPAAAGERERLRAAALQRRHRRGRALASDGRVAAAFARGERVDRAQPQPSRRGRHRLRDDDPQEPGLPVRHRRRPAARAGVTDPHPGAALHRGHPGPAAADPGRDRGGVRAAVERPVARASGLGRRLWGDLAA